MPLTSTPPGILDVPRLAGRIGESLTVVLAGLVVVPALVARAHQVLDADDRTS
jgi:hypothetical protein